MDRKPTYEELKQRVRELEEDVSDLSQFKEALTQEDLFHTLVESTSDIVFVVDRKGMFTYVNPTFERVTGYTSPELTGRPFTCVIAPEQIESTVNRFKKGIRAHVYPPYEADIVDIKGTRTPVEFHVATLYDKNGRPTGRFGIGRDITERKKDEEIYRTLADTSRAGVYIIQDGKFQFINYNAARYAGYTEEEMLGLKSISIVHPEDMETATRSAAEMLGGKRTAPHEFRIITKDGKIRWIMETLTSIDYRGKRAVLGNSIDVTEIREARSRLEEGEKRLSQIVAGISIATFVINSNHIVTHWNRACENLTGIPAHEVIGTGKQWTAFYHSERPVLADLVVDYIPEEEIAVRYSGRCQKSDVIDGAYEAEDFFPDIGEDGRWLFFTAAPLKSVGGEIIGSIETLQDITERKQAEKQFREYSEKLESIVEERTSELRRALYDTEEARDRMDGILKSVADGLIVTDIYNRIILMNRAAEDLLGIRFSEVIDRPIEVALRDETMRELLKTTIEKRETGHHFDYELPGEDPKHPEILRARTSIIEGKDSKYSGVIIILSDVTWERELDRMKSEFISMAAHELRNPLTSIMGYSELLMIRDDIKEEMRKKYISNINKQSVILAEIINDLLDVSRIESGKGFALNKVPSDMSHIIREVTSSFQLQTDKHTFDIILPEEPVVLMVDREKIEQVLGNILSNAVKYSPEGGAIRLSAKKILDFGIGNSEPEEDEKESAFRTSHSALEISIADQGIGMTPDQVEKIFVKFYRADTSDTTISGTGLGMSIVKQLIKAHNGKVWVESKLGKGTTVRFTIPMRIQ